MARKRDPHTMHVFTDMRRAEIEITELAKRLSTDLSLTPSSVAHAEIAVADQWRRSVTNIDKLASSFRSRKPRKLLM